MTAARALATPTRAWTVLFDSIEPGDLARVGGKGLNLGKLRRAGLAVPPGFCVSTDAYWAVVAGDDELDALLAEVEVAAAVSEPAAITGPAARLRAHIESRSIPADIAADVVSAWRTLGADAAFAVRSSATAEDLPEASFAGQQDTYLNVVGETALLDAVRSCWASLFTDRAIVYREQNGIGHREVALSVVVQRMVQSDKSGILFTADPITGHRDVIAIDAGFGLGEALVSGLISPDLYKLDKPTGRVVDVTIGDKQLAIRPVSGGGTVNQELSERDRTARVLDADELAALHRVAVTIEDLQGSPQDVEWCIEDGELFVVQSRPITSLYPMVEPAPPDDSLRVWLCVNHLQVMTDPMPPMAFSMWGLMIPFGRPWGTVEPSPWLGYAGSRLYLDMSEVLRQPSVRRMLLKRLPAADRLAAAGIEQITSRPEFARGPRLRRTTMLQLATPRVMMVLRSLLFRRPDGAAERELQWIDDTFAEIERRVTSQATAVDRLRVVREVLATSIEHVQRLLMQLLAALVAGRILRRLVGPDRPGDDPIDFEALSRGLPGNVTTEMDLAVGDLADLARQQPQLRELLAGEPTLEEIEQLPEAAEFVAAFRAFLDRYGARAPSEIDVSRARWREEPSSILRAIAGNLRHDEPGRHRAHHAALERAAEVEIENIMRRARHGVLGFARARLARRMLRVVRGLLPLREHHKFLIVQVIDLTRRELVRAADELVAADRLDAVDDVWFLTLDELSDAVAAPGPDLRAVVASRRDEFERHHKLYPPRVLTSRGERPIVAHDASDLPPGALVGSPASGGVVEGIARVIRDPTREVLHKGEILIAPFTDPGWTPLFLNAAGLVMEVGGLMTHGSVVAREYGIPAVVCVPDATRSIQTGQRVRVDGDRGCVELLDEPAPSAEEAP